MNLPILYSFRRCPYAMRARMALATAGVECELREVVLRNKPAHMLEISPKGTVPILLLPDGGVLEESLEVMRWALRRNDPANWLKPLEDPEIRDQAQKLIDENDGAFKFHLDRYKYAARHPDQDPLEHRAQGEAFLRKLDTQIGETAYLFGSEPCFADIAIFPFVRQFARVDTEWFESLPCSGLQAWLERLETGPLFTSIMQKYAAWRSGDPVTYFLAESVS